MNDNRMKELSRLHTSCSRMLKRRYLVPVLTCVLTFSVTTVFASGGGAEAEGGHNWLGFAWRAFNFAVLAGLLYWLLAEKTKDFFGGRRQDIKKVLAEAEAAKEEAKKKFAEYDAKLNKATGEIAELTEMIRMQGEAEKERILADARRSAAKLKDDTKKRMEQELNMARSSLRSEAVRLSVQMAEEILRKQITPDDHVNMVEDAIDRVVTNH